MRQSIYEESKNMKLDFFSESCKKETSKGGAFFVDCTPLEIARVEKLSKQRGNEHDNNNVLCHHSDSCKIKEEQE